MPSRHRVLAALVALSLLGPGVVGRARAESRVPTSEASRAAMSARKARKKLARAIRKKGLVSLPSMSHALASRGGAAGLVTAAAVVGSPPTLVEIAAGDPTSIFWEAGLVAAIAAGTPTQNQCNDFWAGQTDGASAGLGACRMAQSLAQSFGKVMQSDNSVCYMRNVPTQANLDSGGLQVVSGELPSGGIGRLFSTAGGDGGRLVEVQVTGQERDQRVMLRLPGAAENAAAGNLYAVDLYFCPMTPGASPTGYERLTLGTDGHFVASEAQSEGERSHTSTVDGWVVGSGQSARWDTRRPRTIAVEFGDVVGTFKAGVEVGDDVISTRSWSYFGDDWRSLTVTRFSGSSGSDVRFLAGAFSGASGGGQTNTGTAEFRDPFYVTAPGLDLLAQVESVDLATDPFFATPPVAPTVDTTGFSCDVSGDIVVAMDFSNPTIAAIRDECEGPRLDGLQLCDNDPTVQAAMQNFGSACGAGGPN